MTNPLIKFLDELIAQESPHSIEWDDLRYIKQLALAEAKHQEDWKARFMELRAKHEGIMKAERERIVKELEAQAIDSENPEYADDWLHGEAAGLRKAIKIVKGEC